MQQRRDDVWPSRFDVDALRSLGARRRFPAGAVVFVEGDEPHDVLIVDDGHVKVTTTAASGQELVLDVVGPGELLGELSAVDGAPRSATAAALTQVAMTAVSADRFVGYLGEHPDAMRTLLVAVVARLRQGNRRQLEYSTGDALGRVCRRLDELAGRYGSGDGPAVDVELALTQTELAQWCGLSREAVVKALRKLRDLGWVRTDGGRTTVVEPDQLRRRGML